jgi:hypothetical protein
MTSKGRHDEAGMFCRRQLGRRKAQLEASAA